jgi:hypothetical protein
MLEIGRRTGRAFLARCVSRIGGEAVAKGDGGLGDGDDSGEGFGHEALPTLGI